MGVWLWLEEVGNFCKDNDRGYGEHMGDYKPVTSFILSE